MNPFDYVNEILVGKKNLIVDDASEKDYSPYLVNRSLSYHLDCIMFANEMNRRHHIDKKLQNDFMLNTIRAQKRRFMKWVKPEKSDDLECIKIAYGFSNTKAKEALRLLSEDDLKQLKEKTDIGGKIK